MIIDIEEQLGITASAREFAAKYPEEEDGEEEEEEEEEGGEGEGEGEEEEGGDEEVQQRIPGQQHCYSLMQHLFQQL